MTNSVLIDLQEVLSNAPVMSKKTPKSILWHQVLSRS